MAQPVGDTIPQTQRLFQSVHGINEQVVNQSGGYVSRLDDLKRLKRFLIIGSEGGCYKVTEHMLQRSNVSCLNRLIQDGKGMEAVNLIKEISLNRHNVRHNSLMLAFAICARSKDQDTKSAAYKLLPEICRIPTHLFMFIKYCEQESKEEGTESGQSANRKEEDTESGQSANRREGDMESSQSANRKEGDMESGTGWGRCHRRAISQWYTSKDPEKLVFLVTKYQKRDGWSHKDVLRLAHIKTDDRCIGFVLRYIIWGLKKSKEVYLDNATPMNDETRVKLNKVAELVEVFHDALRKTDEERLCQVIRKHELTWEQCNLKLLNSKAVWTALLPHMGSEALVRNLGRMTSCGTFAETSTEELVLHKIQSMNTEVGNKMLDSQGPREEGQEESRDSKSNTIHPFKVLLGLCSYKTGRGKSGKLSWKPNEKIIEAMDTAFYKAFEATKPTGKRFYLALDVSESMANPVLGSKVINCKTAAAVMMLMTAKTESNYIIKGFSEDLVDIKVTEKDTIEQILDKIGFNLPSGRTDCSRPMFDAQDKKIKDIDVFVVYTANETWYGNVHPQEALSQYRTYTGNRDVKLIVCGMCSTEFSIADPEDANMLDVVGFDSATPRLISEFVMGNV